MAVRGNECEPEGGHCEPSCNNVGLSAINVGRTHVPESMIVGQRGCSIASRVFSHCEPEHVAHQLQYLIPHAHRF
jgi:hypothetical protein